MKTTTVASPFDAANLAASQLLLSSPSNVEMRGFGPRSIYEVSDASFLGAAIEAELEAAPRWVIRARAPRRFPRVVRFARKG